MGIKDLKQAIAKYCPEKKSKLNILNYRVKQLQLIQVYTYINLNMVIIISYIAF